MIYKCEACGGVLVYDPDLGKMKCTQCGQISERRSHMKLKEADPDAEEKEDGKRSFDDLWFGLDKDQKWHGEQEIQINPDWDADLLAFEMQNNRPKDISDASTKQTEADGMAEKSGQQAQDASDTDGLRGMQGERLMSVHIFRCTSCGAQIMIHGNERATFCSFCGQPTVIFDRESKEAWPDYIIPFSVTEQQAVDAIKDRFGKGRYVPREIKHLKIDKIRGIYVPYWLYTVYMRKKANLHRVSSDEEKKEPMNIFNAGTDRNQSFISMLQSTKKVGMYPGSFQNQKYEAETRSFSAGIDQRTDMYADAYGNFDRVTFDASRKLDDRLSSRLEPYHMEALKPFDPSYLSGFYADRYDVPSREAAPDIYQRISAAMDKAMIEDTGTTVIERSIEQYSVDKIEYALLPAWFMTFWYKHELYTILVNGQTGKVVGNIPVNKRSFILDAVILGVICCTIGVILFSEVNQGIISGYGFFAQFGGEFVLFPFILAAGFFTRNFNKYRKYKHDKERLTSAATKEYVKERQDKTWIR